MRLQGVELYERVDRSDWLERLGLRRKYQKLERSRRHRGDIHRIARTSDGVGRVYRSVTR